MLSCTDKPVRIFFMLNLTIYRDPWDTWQRQYPPQSGGECPKT
jgi:hypothetical protein